MRRRLRPPPARNINSRNVRLDTGMRASELGGMLFADFDRKRSYHYLCAYLDHWRGEPENTQE